MVLVVALASCKKTPEVNLKYVDVERDLVTVGTTTANIQCDYVYIATLKKAYLFYGEGQDEVNMISAEMRVVQNTLYVELTGLKANSTYSYYYEFHNGFNFMRTTLKSFKTEASPSGVSLPTVITAEVTEITANSAKSGGEVTDDGGAEVTERGICWSTNVDPSLNNSHVAVGMGMGAFAAIINGLESNTTYHVRAYAINEAGTAYGLDREFLTIGGGNDCNHDFVDLGLPSGTLWATCNLGANSPEEYGNYFAWGEIEPKDIYTWSTYKYCNGSSNTLTKYCYISDFGYNGFTDELTELMPEDDAAIANWCNDWCMPTANQWQELIDNTTIVWTSQNGVTGRLFTAANGNSLFLPAAGICKESIINVGVYGNYWSTTFDVIDTDDPRDASVLHFSSTYSVVYGCNRDVGCSVRAVRKSEMPTPPSSVPEGAINGLFTINENGDKVYFSKGNLQYQASTNTWRFAENQWDYVGTQTPGFQGTIGGNVSGSDNHLIASTYNGWIDLFGWGTSNNNHGAVCYQPWSVSNNRTDYFVYGNESFCLYDQTGQADWGYSPIINGGNAPNRWRSIASAEWDYLFDQRNTITGSRFAKAILNNTNGIVLFPDDWHLSEFTFSETNNHYASFSCNVIDSVAWINYENNGAVFLPASGYRIETTMYYLNWGGYYWTASCIDNSAYQQFFSADDMYTHASSRFIGESVRLVQDANPQNKAK